VFDTGAFDQLAQRSISTARNFCMFGRRRAFHRDGAELHDQRPDVRQFRDRRKLGAELVDDGFRRGGGSADERPADGVKARTPASAMVGRLGSAGTRSVEVTPSRETFPA